MKKVLSIVLVSILLIISLPFYSVSLEEKTTENYIYELDEENKIIILKRYIGTDVDVVVPAMFMIDRVCYQTMVTSNFSSQTSTFSGTSVHSIIFEDGVKANCMSFMFKSCTELRRINQFPDYDGVWWSSCFNSCYKLIEAPQIPNDIENIRITAFFKNCYRLLGNYRMPDNYDENNAVGVFDGCDKINNETNVVWFGDSITAGTTTQGISFINFLNDRLANAKIANYGVGGHTLSYGYDGGETAISESIINDVGKFGVHEHIDYVFVSAGTNDYAHNSSRRPYGSYRFADIGSPTDKGMNTVSGAVYNLVKIIETKFPNAEIIFTTPISRAKYDVIGSSATDNSERLIFLKDYVDGIKAACTENGVRFIDTYAESGFDAQLDLCDGTGLYETDMTHPTMLGQEKLADFYLEKLVTTFNFIEKPKAGHAYNDWQVLTEPQCTAPGKCMRRCSVCSYCEYQELHSLSHEYADEYTFDILPTCCTDGSKSRHCSRCDSRIDSTVIPALDHDFETEFTIDVEATATTEGSKSRHCKNCDATTDVTIIAATGVIKNGWILEGGKWAYYQNNTKVTNKWLVDSVGWCYVGADGYCVTNCWKADSKGWCYLDANGRMVVNNWVKDNGKWYFMDGNGYMVSNCWKKDSKGWCHLGSSGAMLTNAWVKDSVGWCYVGADGYCVTNCWKADSYGWCYLDANGRVVTNKWIKYGGNWYYLDGNGYMVTGRQKIDGKYYSFAPNGALK